MRTRKIERREVFASRWRVSSASSRGRARANQLKTALAVQNSIDRMFGDFAGERDEFSDVDRFLEELSSLGEARGNRSRRHDVAEEGRCAGTSFA